MGQLLIVRLVFGELAVKDSPPTKQNLKAQHIPVDETCDRCGDHPKDILYCLWLCDEARTIWRSDPGFQFLHRKNYQSFFDLVTVLLTEVSGYRISLLATTAWCIWQRRNRLRERQPSWQIHEIGDRARELVMEFFEVHKPALAVPTSRPDLAGVLCRWIVIRQTWMLLFLMDWIDWIALGLGWYTGFMKVVSLPL